MRNKILDLENRDGVLRVLRAEGKRIVHCHGAFDLVHPGHLMHFDEAKKLGDVLIVTVTAAKYVQKGPGRPYFGDDLRLMALSCLDMVDYVMLSEDITALSVIDIIKPSVYVKGSEYQRAEDDVTGNIDAEVSRVRHHGGEVYFTGGDVFSSTKLINAAFSALPEGVKEFSKELKEKTDVSVIVEYVSRFKDLSVLVVGDIIIDEYIYCTPQGIMSKDQALSTRHLYTERYLGGSLAIARHLAGFCDNVTLCSITGNDTEITNEITAGTDGVLRREIVFDGMHQTVIKRKYVTKHGLRDEYNKIFSINYLNEKNVKAGGASLFGAGLANKLESLICSHDMVVVCDYGHGLIDDATIRLIEEKSKYLALNCQTNSSNYGFNLITKYRRADCFALDEREAVLALHDNASPKEDMIRKLRELLSADCGVLTLGSEGAIAVDLNGDVRKCPAMTLTAKDTIGAGDALFSIACLAAYCKLPLEIILLLGGSAGAISVNVLSNSMPINKANVLKFVQTVLNV